MINAAEVPAEAVAAMRADPSWAGAEAVAHTLVYESALMGPDNPLPAELLATLRQPMLVLTGGNSPVWLTNAGKAVTAAVPHATHRVLEGQAHNVATEAIVPELLEFFVC
jgi:pimeloyl-ACP methyl ester carboxylesterase